jgi:hypothetical protein
VSDETETPTVIPLFKQDGKVSIKQALWETYHAIYVMTVPSQNLKPDILMMKPAENWYCCDMADLLWAPKIRCILVQ